MRRSELPAPTMVDVQFQPGGVLLRIHRFKTVAEAVPERCPTRVRHDAAVLIAGQRSV